MCVKFQLRKVGRHERHRAPRNKLGQQGLGQCGSLSRVGSRSKFLEQHQRRTVCGAQEAKDV